MSSTTVWLAVPVMQFESFQKYSRERFEGSFVFVTIKAPSGKVSTFTKTVFGADLSEVSGEVKLKPVEEQKKGSYLQLMSLQSVFPSPSLSFPSPHCGPNSPKSTKPFERNCEQSGSSPETKPSPSRSWSGEEQSSNLKSAVPIE